MLPSSWRSSGLETGSSSCSSAKIWTPWCSMTWSLTWETGIRYLLDAYFKVVFTRLSGLTNSDFKVYLENSLRMDPKRSDNLEMRNGNTYPTLPLLEKPQVNGTWRHPDMEKPQAPYMDTPWIPIADLCQAYLNWSLYESNQDWSQLLYFYKTPESTSFMYCL